MESGKPTTGRRGMDQAGRLELAIRQIEFSRQYTLSLLEDLTDQEWFAQPAGAETHIAWQVGHLAMAEYGLCLFRVRGRQEADLELMSSQFRKRFSRGSTPSAVRQPPLDELRAVFQRVHAQTLAELPGYTATLLAEPIDEPYAVFANKMGALLFCSAHEMLHAGQIGLLRRQLGKPPLR